jgi:hypothetical protein
MLILFIIIILFLILLIFFAGTTGTVRSTRARLNHPYVPVSLPPKPETQPLNPPPRFTPATPQTLKDLFVPVPGSREVDQPFQYSDAEIRKMFEHPPVFGGQEKNFDWDALCRVTGQTHRICTCEYCQMLRSRNGASQ